MSIKTLDKKKKLKLTRLIRQTRNMGYETEITIIKTNYNKL